MEDLPVDVMADIISRLHVKTIIQCKCVCKKWRNIVLDSYFADLQLSRSPPGFMIYHKLKLEYHNYEEDEVDHHHLHLDPVTSLDLNLAPIFQKSFILAVDSVNGLLCMRQLGYGKDNTFICNPLTREYIILPGHQYYRLANAFSVYCFGYCSLTHEYKVIWIFQRMHSPPKHISKEAMVYTLGTGHWRSLGQVPYLLRGFNGPFLNGHAHWTVDDKDSPESIYAFDFDKETFELFPSPPSEANGSLGVLKDCLCQCENYDNKVLVWVMKEYGIKNSWSKELVIKESISPGFDVLSLKPMFIIGCFNDGTILMGSCGVTHALFVYCPRRKTAVDTQIFDHHFKGHAYRPTFHRLQSFEKEKVDVF